MKRWHQEIFLLERGTSIANLLQEHLEHIVQPLMRVLNETLRPRVVGAAQDLPE